ncbi:type II toxin-antitoxin system HipA family toxin [Demequina aurantiaca]|uniref:type II toxin-antitoxin system HipA family toxin n=1 Tax=Demequina aurantiaca TaxID=676200 RepID=UPI003D32BEC1
MTTVETFVDLAGHTRFVGRADFTRSRGAVSTTFRYDAGYLADRETINIDPSLRLVEGAQHVTGLLAAFADTAPDRWGRNLIDRAERAGARAEGRRPRSHDDVDYLLAVSDNTRQGALRFRMAGDAEFVGEPSRVPQQISLPHLLHASDRLSADAEATEAVKELLNTGTTGLGGARPKASVLLEDGSLGIAKFPHASDEWDVIAWEAAALDLLGDAGIRVPQHERVRVADRSILLLRRFDRDHHSARRAYVSAMTATGSRDGDRRDYADIFAAMRDMADAPRDESRELYDRVIASVALGNTDDHLRNHGFVAVGPRWALSPAFDVNPNPDLAKSRATSIAGATEHDDEIEGLLSLADDAGLTLDQARRRFAHMAAVMKNWHESAARHGIPAREVAMMADSIEPRLEAVAKAGSAGS